VKSIFAALLSSIVFTVPALAQDVCSDILADGSLKNINLDASDHVKLAFMNRLYRMDESEAREEVSHVGSFDMLGYGIMADSSNYAEAYETLTKVFEQEQHLKMDRKEELKLLASSGDETIVKAWLDCMMRDEEHPAKAYVESYGKEGTRDYAIISLFYETPRGSPPAPTILDIQPQELLAADFGRLKVGAILEHKNTISSKFFLPESTTNLDGKPYDLHAIISIERLGDLVVTLPAIPKNEPSPPEPWLVAGASLTVNYARLCNPGAVRTNHRSCHYQGEQVCSSMGYNYDTFIKQTCMAQGSKCAVDILCAHETYPGKVSVLKFDTLYPCNTGAANDSGCGPKAQKRCESLGLDYVIAKTMPSDRKECEGINCQVVYECVASKDMIASTD